MVPESSRAAPAAHAYSPGASGGSERVERDALALGENPGLRLLPAGDSVAQDHARAIARALCTVFIVEHAARLQSVPDGAEAMRLAIRDAIVLEQRRLAKIFQGRITRIDPPSGTSPRSTSPPARIELHLETDEDARTIHLEGAWAWNLIESGAALGDIIQVERQNPLITLLNKDDANEGRVLDEREHRLQITLGALDRAHAADTRAPRREDEPNPETEAPEVIAEAARRSMHLIGTGERPPTGTAARVRTDDWVRRRLGEKHTRLRPGVLLVLPAGKVPASAQAAIWAAGTGPTAPHTIVSDADASHLEALAAQGDDVQWLGPLP